MTEEEADKLPCGLYRIEWANGGTSVASVGKDRYGNPWYAPANWVSVPGTDWNRVNEVTLIERAFADCDG